MNIKYKHLLNLLENHQIKVETLNFGFTNKENEPLNGKEGVLNVYRELGGSQSDLPDMFFEWNFSEPKKIIVLDDPLTFNRYRALTLREKLYENLTWFPLENYRRFCRNYEKECLKSGMANGIWSNKIANLHFGNASDPGDFFKNGSTGWKLQAFKDFVEDYVAVQKGFKIIRLSVYDNLMIEKKLVRLDSILEKPDHPYYEHVLNYVKRKLV